MARTSNLRRRIAAAPSLETPPSYALPGGPPIPVGEKKRRRSPAMSHEHKLPRHEQAEAARESATVQFWMAADHRARGELQAADIALEWGVFHATRAVLLTAMLGGRHA